MKPEHQDLLQNGSVVDFRPTYDRTADLEHTYLEESVLAGILMDAGATEGDKALGMDYLAALLPASAAFQHSSHRLIYACCLQLHSVGLKPNLQAVALQLADDGNLQSVGGRSKLAQLLDRDPFAVLNLKQNAQFLAQAYQRRRLAEGLNGITKEKDFDTALELAQKEIECVRQMRSAELQAKLSAQSMRTLIIETLDHNLGEAQQREALNNLALDSRWNPKEVRELVEIVEAELDCESSRSERTQKIEQLEEYKGRTLTLSKYLPFSYASPMQKVAEWLGVPSAALLLEMLVGVAGNAHPQTRVIVKESIGFIEPLIIYGGLVTESGQRKSPTVNAVFDAIKQMQEEEEERFRLDAEEYEREQKEWAASCPGKESPEYKTWQDEQPTPPPPLREFYLDIATVEAIDKLKGQQPDTAFVLLKDELSGLFGSYGAYKNGRGEDREAILSGWNGRGRKKNLKGGERVSTLYDAMSILGAIQDSKLQQMMGSFDDDQGDWGRFLWALIPLKALRLPEDDTTFQLAFLKSLFERIRTIRPQKYRLAFDAQRLYEDFHWQLEQRRVAHPQRGMRAAIAKMEGYTARIALALHLLWEVEAGRTPAPYVPRERVQQAIRLTEFFLSQVTLIHSSGSAALNEGGLTPRLSAILGKLKQFGELTARKLQASISWLRKVTPDKLRHDLVELAKLGYGTLQGKGNQVKLVWQPSADTVDTTAEQAADRRSEPEMLDLREFQSEKPQTVDTADIVADVVNSILLPQAGVGSTSSLNAQQHQHISSLVPNSEVSSTLAADTSSAEISAVDDPDPDDEPDNDPPGGSQVPSEPKPDDPNGDGVLELLSDEALQGWFQAMVACTTPDEVLELQELIDALPTDQRAQLEASEGEHWEVFYAALLQMPDQKPEIDQDIAIPEPTLEELKALLLASNTLTVLNELQRTHKKNIGKAYRSMTEKEQAQIDAIAALAVPHKVFKYLGEELTLGTQRLVRGELVYIDPQAQVRATAISAPVWAINGVGSGWKRSFDVSLSFLKEVRKAVLPETENPDDGQQMGLI